MNLLSCRNVIVMLVVCVGLSLTTMGCAEEAYYTAPGSYTTGTVEFCDDMGCRTINSPYYYANGELFYWDAHFGYWIGPHAWFGGGVWHSGLVPGYHGWYHSGFYHGYHDGGWREGSGYHGGGFHGHGGHR